jgi:hypothetical protein
MAFKFYLDGLLTDQPTNDNALVTTIKRDSDLGGFLTTQDVTLEYSADNAISAGEVSGYTYLKSKFDSGTCNEVNVVIYDQISSTESRRVYTGVMKVPSMVIKEGYVSITTKIDDNSFYSYIKNNQNVKFNLYATKTKNGEAITPPQVYNVDMFFGANGTYLSLIGNLYQGYRVYDVLKFLVPAISDNKVTFESDYLSSPDIQLFIFDGSALVNPNSQPNIEVSFAQLREELFKLKNLSFYIDQSAPDAPVLRLEEQAWFYLGTNMLTITEERSPVHLSTSIKSSKLYGTVKVGSSYNPGGAAAVYTFNAGTSYFGWKEEVYTPTRQCNTDNELNLVNQFGISNNAINYQVNGASTTELDSLFLVECHNVDTTAFTADAYPYEIYGNSNKRFYNVGLNNVAKIGLHGGNFQTALSNTQDAGVDICHISLGQDMVIANFNTGVPGATGSPYTVLPIPFSDEFGGPNYDGGNNWDLTNFWYTAPSNGNYSFITELNIQITNTKYCAFGASITNGSTTIQTEVARGIQVRHGFIAYEDSTLATIIGTASFTAHTYVDGFYTLQGSFPVQLPAGAVVRAYTTSTAVSFAPASTGTLPSGQVVNLTFGNTPLTSWVIAGGCGYVGNGDNIVAYLEDDSFFECNGVPGGALVLAQPDPQLFKIKLHEFTYPLTATEFYNILSQPIGRITFTKDGLTRSGYIEQLTHNNTTGATTFKLISEDATT